MTSPTMVGGGAGAGAGGPGGPPTRTGRYVITFEEAVGGDEAVIADCVRSVAGASSLLSSSDFESGALDVGQASRSDAVVFPDLGVAVVSIEPGRLGSVLAAAEADARVLAVEPERVLRAIGGSLPLDYLRGYRDAAAHLYEVASAAAVAAVPGSALASADTAQHTWGIEATMADTSPRTGAGIAVAILDTGLELAHPDFDQREVSAQSFIAGEAVQDVHGHGTHCVGTVCGMATSRAARSRRYGVAPDAEVFVGKVLGDDGSGTDTSILSGISWAVSSGCQVISMSLGADERAVSVAYERVGRRALASGSLIVAAAGNNAERSDGRFGFVGVPANSPSVLAVGAVDSNLAVAEFSARSNPVEGGQVDIAAPGVDVWSAWVLPDRYRSISGTSMATPHVAGLAALWAEASGLTGAALWARLQQRARRLVAPSADIGAGLALAPQE